MASDLVLIDSARQALAEAQSFPETLNVRDKLQAIELYLKRRGGAAKAALLATCIRIGAEKKLGRFALDDPSYGRGMKSDIVSGLKVTTKDLWRWQQIASLPEAIFDEELAKPEPTTAALVKRARKLSVVKFPKRPESPTCTVVDLEQLADEGKTFGTVYADPPWQYGNQSTRASTDNHYVTMPFDEIAALPVEQLAEEKSHLHLWTTNGFIREAFSLIEAWGFEYKSMFVWVKPEMGIGNYWRVSHEVMLLGVRGTLTFADHSQRSWLEASRMAHSAKPHGVRDIIEKTSPGPYLELFGRQAHPRWTVWGNEVESTLFARAAGMDGGI